jgi:hypothetical protein
MEWIHIRVWHGDFIESDFWSKQWSGWQQYKGGVGELKVNCCYVFEVEHHLVDDDSDDSITVWVVDDTLAQEIMSTGGFNPNYTHSTWAYGYLLEAYDRALFRRR